MTDPNLRYAQTRSRVLKRRRARSHARVRPKRFGKISRKRLVPLQLPTFRVTDKGCVYGTGTLCEIVGVSYRRWRALVLAKAVPPCAYVDSSCHHWYPASYIRAMRWVLHPVRSSPYWRKCAVFRVHDRSIRRCERENCDWDALGRGTR